MSTHGSLLSCLVLGLLAFAGSASAVEPLGDLTGPWQLFVDDYAVDQKTNVVRTYHPFQKYAGNPVIVADNPWEGVIYAYGTALPTEDHTGYRLWYHSLNSGDQLLYATSTDGIHWTKPILNNVSWNGSTANNIFFARNNNDHIASLIHTPWEADPQRRYKLMNFNSPLGGFLGAYSADGIDFVDEPGNPLVTGTGDVGNFVYDFHASRYVGYVKLGAYVNGQSRRSVGLTSTTNYTSWPAATLIVKPDDFDDRWAINDQKTDFYGMCGFSYESMYIAFLWVLRVDDYFSGCQDGLIHVEMVSSRDGIHWKREEGDRPPIVPRGGAGAWDYGMIFTTQQPLVENGQIKLYYGGINGTHCGSGWVGGMGLATMRKDGFASLDAGSTGGSITTRRLVNASGTLRANYTATAGGGLLVEVLDENGQIVPGYSQADCTMLTGDGLDQPITWGATATLPSITPLRLRFVLNNASIYSFRTDGPVTVLQPPTITRHPATQRIVPAGNAQFTVTAEGDGALTYQWRKGGLPLADGGHYNGTQTSTLTVSSAGDDDLGAYDCVVTDAGGSTASQAADLKLGYWMFRELALPGAADGSAFGMTSDGTAVCGNSGGRAFVWTFSQGVKDLGLPADATAISSAGVLAKPDGRLMVVGTATTATGVKAVRWDGTIGGVGTFSDLKPVYGTRPWTPHGVGTDGNELWVVGSSVANGDGNGREAVMYRQSTNSTVAAAPIPTGGHDDSDLYAVADTGATVGQYQYGGTAPAGGTTSAMYGTPRAVLVPINSLAGTASLGSVAVARTISRDGQVQGGWSGYAGGGVLVKPVLWTTPTALSAIPFTPGESLNNGQVRALNADGSIAGGRAWYEGATTGVPQAFIWDATNGTRKLQNVIAAQGFDLTDLTLTDAAGFSEDGSMMCGNGMKGSAPRGWVLTFVDASPQVPIVLADPASQTRYVGAATTMTVWATGDDPLSYQWQKEGVALADGGVFSGTTTPTLAISYLSFDLAGGYRCRVSNSHGQALSAPGILTVVTVPPDFDGDGDVDQADFGFMQACITGATNPQNDSACGRPGSMATTMSISRTCGYCWVVTADQALLRIPIACRN